VTEALNDLWRTATEVGPKLVVFGLFLIGGIILGKICASIVSRVLLRVGFNRLLDRANLNKALGKSYGHELVGKLAFYAVLLIALQLAFGVFGPNPVSHLITSVIAFLPRLAVALVLVVVASTIATAVKSVVAEAIGGLSYGKVAATLAYAAILALGVIAALGQVGVALTVTLPVLIAVLGTVAGILIVGVGGGLIQPMQGRWENYLTTAEAEHRNRDSE
jgi:hypothetical protein